MVRRVNLLPASERRRTQTDFGLLIVIIAAVVVVGGLTFGFVYLMGVRSDREKDLEALQRQNQQLQQQVAAFNEFEVLQSTRVATEKVVQSIYAGRTLMSDIVGDISLVVPDNVWFQSLTISAPDIPGTGASQSTTGTSAGTSAQPEGNMAVEGKTYSFEDVATFLVRLEQIPFLKSITLNSAKSEQDSQNMKSFTVNSKVVNTQSAETPLPVTQLEAEQR